MGSIMDMSSGSVRSSLMPLSMEAIRTRSYYAQLCLLLDLGAAFMYFICSLENPTR